MLLEYQTAADFVSNCQLGGEDIPIHFMAFSSLLRCTIPYRPHTRLSV
jgi:hypothetical protein